MCLLLKRISTCKQQQSPNLNFFFFLYMRKMYLNYFSQTQLLAKQPIPKFGQKTYTGGYAFQFNIYIQCVCRK